MRFYFYYMEWMEEGIIWIYMLLILCGGALIETKTKGQGQA